MPPVLRARAPQNRHRTRLSEPTRGNGGNAWQAAGDRRAEGRAAAAAAAVRPPQTWWDGGGGTKWRSWTRCRSLRSSPPSARRCTRTSAPRWTTSTGGALYNQAIHRPTGIQA
eukprot:530417-Prorocentrum_minimum.AAC.1